MRKRSVVLYDMQYRCPLRWSRTRERKNLITNDLMSDSEGDEKKFSIRISSYINKLSHSFLAWFQTLSLSSAYIFISSLPLSLTCRIRTRGLIVIPYTRERNNKNFIRGKGFNPPPPLFSNFRWCLGEVRKNSDGSSSFTGSGLFVLMSQCGNNNEFALQHGEFCTMWSFVVKDL